MENFVAGWAGGIANLIVCFPIDTVKVHLQSSQTPHVGSAQYRSALDCALKIVFGGAGDPKGGGIRALYRGVTAPLAVVGFSNAALFGVYGSMLEFFSHRRALLDQQNVHLTSTEQMTCGICAGATASFLNAPFELAKIRLQTMPLYHKHRQYRGAWDCMRKMYGQGGIGKLYTGLLATFIRDIPFAVIYFKCYTTLRQLLPRYDDSYNISSALVAGGCAGWISWLCIFPLDTVKTTVQTALHGRYRGWAQTAKAVYMCSGVPGFYIGIGPALLRAFIQNAVTWAGVEVVYRLAGPYMGATQLH